MGIAEPMEMAIKVAAEVEAADRTYCEDIIAPVLANAST
jgi:hypothetical protein